MIKEKWTDSYVTMIVGEQKITLKVVHYECSGSIIRSWYRIYDHGVSCNPQENILNKRVGYGFTFELALEKLIEKRHGKFLPNTRA